MQDLLVDAARHALDFAYAPFSNFKVGAAVEDEQGRIFTGCNVENASYGLTICAERVAVFKAISEGAKSIHRVAVVTGAQTLTAPCGACRQVLWEFGQAAVVITANLEGIRQEQMLAELLPRAFDSTSLK